MKKSCIAGLIGIAFLAVTNAHAVQINQNDAGLDVRGDTIVSGNARVKNGLVVQGDASFQGNNVEIQKNAVIRGDARIEKGFVTKGHARFENSVLFGQSDNEGNITGDYVTVVNGDVNASGNVYSGSGHSVEGNWTAIQDVDSRLSSVDGRLSGVEKRLSDVKKTFYRGIAAVTAIANIPTVEQGKRFAVGVGVGNFEGENALAIGASIRANESLTFKASAGKSGSSTAYGAGAALSF